MNTLFSKPFALSMGPQACGSDILHAYFNTRPDVGLPDVQEIFYFDRHMQRGPEFYKDHFEDTERIKLFMELTTTAFDHAQAPARVRELLGPDVKLFCPLRDPVQRSLSVYKHYLRYNIVKGDIREACEEAPQILHASRYADHLEAWLDTFKNIHFLTYEALQTDRDITLSALCSALDIPPSPPRRSMSWHKIVPQIWFGQTRSIKPNQDDIAWLSGELADETTRTEALIGQNIFS